MGLEELPPAELGEWFTEEKRLLAQRVLREEYEQGRSIAQIALDTGYSVTRVRKLLLREGVALRSRAGSRSRGSA
ncbi:helix-turn-helix domain-containing protein [Kineococcus sp. NPDC059986]|jgi:hypothetical protein|uniref:helix-turn-helix domain-containing protein n=1 Tax=Kineococcus sp. NPDC059986 TaxID=3155538 RepID=UPI00344D6D25